MSSEDFDDAVEEEMGALEAILMEDVTVLRSGDGHITGVEVCVVPATAQQVSQQHVRCTLVATFPAQYPSVQPKVLIRNPRGIDDSVLQKVEQEMASKCQECEGSPVIYELVELLRENLTENNTPSCPCTICLYHFHPSDHFTKTHCFHYFHKHCMGRYVKNCELTHAAAVAEQQLAPWQPQPQLQLTCPVCREPISVEESVESLLSFPGPTEEENEEQWRPDAPDVLALRRSMARLFLQQQQRGGIIDVEQERNKYFVSLMVNESNIEQVSVEESTAEESLENDKKDLTPPRDRSADVDDEIGAVDHQSTCPNAIVVGHGVDTGSSDRASSSRVIGQPRFERQGRENQSHGDIRRHGREDKSRGDFRVLENQSREGQEVQLHQDIRGREDQPLYCDSRGRRGRSWYGTRGRGYGDGALVHDGFGRGRRGGLDHHRSRGELLSFKYLE
ncbi:RWD domain [Trinorchestia longiramus]|nr:RWD domain [Trinorchestia longiramus]